MRSSALASLLRYEGRLTRLRSNAEAAMLINAESKRVEREFKRRRA